MYIAVIRRRISVTLFRDIFLLRAFLSATIYLWMLTRYKSLYRVVKVYGDTVGADFSPDFSRGAPWPMILKPDRHLSP